MVDYDVIGERIRENRKQHRLTQEKLAEYCGITVEYLSKIENGKAKPTLDTLGKICEVLNCDMSCLFSGAVTGLENYKLEEISMYYQNCKPEIKPLALDLIKKLSTIE